MAKYSMLPLLTKMRCNQFFKNDSHQFDRFFYSNIYQNSDIMEILKWIQKETFYLKLIPTQIQFLVSASAGRTI